MILSTINQRRMCTRCFLMLWVMLAATVVFCQTNERTGQIVGAIKDAEGRGVANATVILVSQSTGLELKREAADANGSYVIANLKYGTYELSASAQGYAQSKPRLVILTSSARTVDLILESQQHGTVLGPAGDAKRANESKQAPAFSSAGIRGTIAPSGYSTGLSNEEAAQVNQKVSELGANTLAGLIPEVRVVPCNQEPSLLQAVKADSSAFGPNRELGLFYLGHGEFNKGIPYLEAAHAAAPGDDKNSQDLAAALLAASRGSEAIAILKPLSARQSGNPVIARLLAAAYEAAGNSEEAKSVYLQAARLDAGIENQFESGMGLIRSGALGEARTLFSAATTAHSESAQLWMGLGIAEDLLEHKAAAVHALINAVDREPGYIAPYSFLADLAGSVPESDAGIHDRLARLLITQPENATGHFDYALALWKQHRGESSPNSRAEIVEQLKVALDKNPQLARARFLLGQVYADAADLTGAEQELRAAVELEPGNAAAHYRLSQVYRRQGRMELANTEMSRFRALHGSSDGDGILPPSVGAGFGLRQSLPRSSVVSCPPLPK